MCSVKVPFYKNHYDVLPLKTRLFFLYSPQCGSFSYPLLHEFGKWIYLLQKIKLTKKILRDGRNGNTITPVSWRQRTAKIIAMSYINNVKGRYKSNHQSSVCPTANVNALETSTIHYYLLVQPGEQSRYKVVQIWPGQTVTCLHTNLPGHIWTTLYLPI
jgi:hypothetical protein